MSQIQPYGVRLAWAEVPAVVHAWVEQVLEAEVIDARSQQGGFSPGVAQRVVAANGRRGFVKAVGREQNVDSPGLLRREADVLGAMPDDAGVPALLASYDDGDWVGLLIEDVEGRHPRVPWQDDEVRATFIALRELGQHRAPSDWPALEDHLADMFAAWPRIDVAPLNGLDPWLADRFDDLGAHSEAVLPRLAGQTIVHMDTRSDNLLVTPQGRVRIVDWPWASRGTPWFDAVTLLVNLELYGGVDATRYVPVVRDLGASDEDIAGVLAGMCGYFTEAATRPPPPGLPTVRTFQAAQGRACVGLLQRLASGRGALT